MQIYQDVEVQVQFCEEQASQQRRTRHFSLPPAIGDR